jgi:methylated-DNA-[protein]-cysteine S-methyltransferase
MIGTVRDTMIMDSPIGPIRLACDGEALTGVWFVGRWPAARPPRVPAEPADPAPALLLARTQLREYFAGVRTAFDLAVAPRGTPFQQAVWAALREIPFGRTTSYSGIARSIGRPDAVRAVGAANGSNPIPIIQPCHRVVGADGSLTGFGGGLERKRWLLAHESPQAPLWPARSTRA